MRFFGILYCYQGKRLKGQWYLSLIANPEVEVLLPDGHLLGFAEEVTDSRGREIAMGQILRSSGIGSSIYGFNPFTASDELIQEKTRDIPVIKITPIRGNKKDIQQPVVLFHYGVQFAGLVTDGRQRMMAADEDRPAFACRLREQVVEPLNLGGG